MIEGGSEYLAGITCNILSHHNSFNGAYDIVASSFSDAQHQLQLMVAPPKRLVGPGHGMATKDNTCPPSDDSSDTADKDDNDCFENSMEREDENKVAPTATTDTIKNKEETANKDPIGKAKGDSNDGKKVAGEDPTGEE